MKEEESDSIAGCNVDVIFKKKFSLSEGSVS